MAGQELAGTVAIITGGTRGRGRACADKFAGAGAQVVITGLDPARGAAAAKSIGSSAHFVKQDVSQAADWANVMNAAAKLGPRKTMVANAGISNFVPMELMDLETFRGLMEINLKGAFLSLKHAVAAMRDHGKGGSIIMMSSVMGRMSAPANVHYSGSKAGIRLMMKAAALELGLARRHSHWVHQIYELDQTPAQRAWRLLRTRRLFRTRRAQRPERRTERRA